MQMYKKAFTLVELAIVLIIIGLITGGVVGAQSLINSAKMNSQISEITSFDTAANAFALEYGALPGDIARADAQSYGFDVSVYTNTDFVHNQDGYINLYFSTSIATSALDNGFTAMYSNWGEPMFFFIHLANAGFLDYPFVETGYASGTGQQAGIHGPALKIGNEDSMFIANTDKAGQLHYFMGIVDSFTGHYGNAARFGAIAPKDARKLDLKLDDGIPNSGYIRSLNYNSGVIYDTSSNCTQNSGANYNLSDPDEECTLSIKANISNGS